MEATLLHLIFNIAAVLVAEIAKHLGEHPFQGIILHLAARLFTGLNLLVAVVADIEGSTIEMTRISVALPFRVRSFATSSLVRRMLVTIILCSGMPLICSESNRHGRYPGAAQRHEAPGKECCCSACRHKERIAAHIHQLALAVLRLQTVLYRFHTMLSSRQNLHILLVGESIAEMRHREDAMLHLLAILVEKIEGLPLCAVSGITESSSFFWSSATFPSAPAGASEISAEEASEAAESFAATSVESAAPAAATFGFATPGKMTLTSARSKPQYQTL